VGTGSREENASKQKLEPRSDSIGTEKALGAALSADSQRARIGKIKRGWPFLLVFPNISKIRRENP
jgi:hypothetical protein